MATEVHLEHNTGFMSGCVFCAGIAEQPQAVVSRQGSWVRGCRERYIFGGGPSTWWPPFFSSDIKFESVLLYQSSEGGTNPVGRIVTHKWLVWCSQGCMKSVRFGQTTNHIANSSDEEEHVDEHGHTPISGR